MKICVFDTETTGFINKKETNLNLQPRIIQFAGIIGSLDGRKFVEEKRINLLINPKIPIPFDSTEVHNIYDIDVKDSPYIIDIINELILYINTVDIIVGHNIEYDEEMIKLELKRLNKEYEYNPKQVVCTMKSSVDFCELEGNGNRFKYPKLGELHKKLFGEYYIGAHNAISDVEATLKCFIELVNNGIIKIENRENKIMSLF